MKGSDLLILKAELDIKSNAELNRRLGIRGTHTLYDYLLREELPLTLALACAAAQCGLDPYEPDGFISEAMQLKMAAESASTLAWLEKRLGPKQRLTEGNERRAAREPDKAVIEA